MSVPDARDARFSQFVQLLLGEAGAEFGGDEAVDQVELARRRGGGEEENDTIGLALGADPLDALLPMWRFELDRRRFLTTSAYSVAAAALPLSYVQEIANRTAAAHTGHTGGMAEVAAVRDMVGVFSEMDERHGGQHARSALVTYLRDDVAPLYRGRFRTEEIRRQMLSAASRGVHLLGWKSYDSGQQGLAQRYYFSPTLWPPSPASRGTTDS